MGRTRAVLGTTILAGALIALGRPGWLLLRQPGPGWSFDPELVAMSFHMPVLIVGFMLLVPAGPGARAEWRLTLSVDRHVLPER